MGRPLGKGPGEELYDDFRSLFETRPQILPDYTSYSSNLPSTMHFMDHNDLHTIWTMGEDEYDPRYDELVQRELHSDAGLEINRNFRFPQVLATNDWNKRINTNS